MQDETLLVSLATATADEVISALGLQPHPEGGHFVETFRDRKPGGERGACTAIYFLLRSGEVSHWHRVDAIEIWHWYAGAPLMLRVENLFGVVGTTWAPSGAATERTSNAAVRKVPRLRCGGMSRS